MKTFTVLFFTGIVILFGSCNTPRYMYSPSAQNVPVLVKQGDSKLAASYSTDFSDDPLSGQPSSSVRQKNHGFDLQGAVAITNHFAIQANYFNRTERNSGTGNYYDSMAINYKRNLAEVGIGYFRPMNTRETVLFQVFGGVGKGTFSFTDRGIDPNNVSYLKSHQADVLKVYVQPAFLFRPRENFVLSISTRMSIINFRNIKTDYTLAELQEYRLDDLPYGYRAFWEPAFTNSFGFKKLPGIRFEYQFSASVLASERHIDHRAFNFSLGVQLDIPKLFRSSQATE